MIRRVVLICSLLLANRAYGADWACAAAEQSCKPVFIVHSSWHAAIVLPKNDTPPDAIPELVDFPHAGFIEFSWGDRDYFPDPRAGVFAAIKAAFWSSGSVLHVVGFNETPKSFYADAKIIELRLSPTAYSLLLDYVSKTFLRPPGQRQAEASAGLFTYSRFYPATRKFSLLKTCNTWVAEALESAGLPIAPSYVITAGQLAEQIDKVKENE